MYHILQNYMLGLSVQASGIIYNQIVVLASPALLKYFDKRVCVPCSFNRRFSCSFSKDLLKQQASFNSEASGIIYNRIVVLASPASLKYFDKCAMQF